MRRLMQFPRARARNVKSYRTRRKHDKENSRDAPAGAPWFDLTCNRKRPRAPAKRRVTCARVKCRRTRARVCARRGRCATPFLVMLSYHTSYTHARSAAVRTRSAGLVCVHTVSLKRRYDVAMWRNVFSGGAIFTPGRAGTATAPTNCPSRAKPCILSLRLVSPSFSLSFSVPL